MKKPLRVYIADDHTLFRKAMVGLISSFQNVSEVKDAENGKELLALIKSRQPDVAIVDLQMPVMDGTAASEQILKKYPDVKIIILTMHDSDKFILHMMELGVHGFLLKNTEPEELEKAIDAVTEKDFYHNDLVANVLRKTVQQRKGQRPFFGPPGLSEREKQILVLLCEELSNREIGERLSLSEHTIRNHKANIMEKLGIDNIVGLVRFAFESGLMK